MPGTQDSKPPALKSGGDKPDAPQPRPAIVLIGSNGVTGIKVLRAIRRELTDWDILGFATVKDPSITSGWDVRLVTLCTQGSSADNSGNFPDLAVLRTTFPGTPILLLPHRDKSEMKLARVVKGIRPIDVILKASADRDSLPAFEATPQEKKVLVHVPRGRRNKDITKLLNVLKDAGRMHVRQILHKLRARK